MGLRALLKSSIGHMVCIRLDGGSEVQGLLKSIGDDGTIAVARNGNGEVYYTELRFVRVVAVGDDPFANRKGKGSSGDATDGHS